MLIFLLACTSPSDTGKSDDTAPQVTDADGDGYGEDVDCNDASPAVHPDASEFCDGADNDCDGSVDEDAVDMSTTYTDADGDGYGDAATATSSCEGTGVENAGDCDDGDSSVHPGAEEDCADPIDRDCDGSAGGEDADGDGYLGCDDCDDGAADVNPGATEVCDDDNVDEDCSGTADDADPNTDTATESDWYLDFDNDDHGDADSTSRSACDAPTGYAASSDDCDDHDDDVHPGATEVCDDDNVDEDCSGAADDDDSGVDGDSLLAWYGDGDGDGHGGGSPVAWSCDGEVGQFADDGDCDDGDVTVNPDADEICDDQDNDCDGLTDDDDTVDGAKNTFYDDDDGDGYGDAGSTISACSAPPGWASNPDDCDDGHASAHPGAAEVCDADDVDEDCDGLTDDADPDHTGDSTIHLDADGDGYGAGAILGRACDTEPGQATNALDCDDTNGAISPGATEACDDLDVDEDCDGAADDRDPEGASGQATLYVDGDKDGYGSRTSAGSGCGGDGFATIDNDCNDRDASISPGATEVCDGSDNDCDGSTDEDASGTYWYMDDDGDGYGDDATAFETCTGPTGMVETGGDCDDTNRAVSPAATETCDGVDNDCDDLVDADDPSSGADTWYRDADRDGYGDPESGSVECTAPSGYVLDATDCDDVRASVNPAASESCDDRDNDCDGAIDEDIGTLYPDGDGDGFGDVSSLPTCDGTATEATDCDDTDADVYVGAEEIPGDGADDNCDSDLGEITKTSVTTDTTYTGEMVAYDMVYEGVTVTLDGDVLFQCIRCAFIDSTIEVAADGTFGDSYAGLLLDNSWLSNSTIVASGVDGTSTPIVELELDHVTISDVSGDAITTTMEGDAEATVTITNSVFYGVSGVPVLVTGAVTRSETDVYTFAADTLGIFEPGYAPPRPADGGPLVDTGTYRPYTGDYWNDLSTPADIGAVER